METPAAAAIYARISLDSEGQEKGVKRQVADCRTLAKQLGWKVADTYVDNDISAYSGKRRPEYERMLADIQDGSVDGILVYNIDRLTRQPKEFERFNDIVTAAGLKSVRFVTGDMDFGTDDGLFVGRMLAAFAAKESGAKSRRITRKNEERASEGLPHGGSTRPFGFEDDRLTHNKVEAQAIRTMVNRFIAGESLRSLVAWLQDEGIPTVKGGEWTTNSLGGFLKSPRIAGLREYKGEIVGKAAWKPIITPGLRDRVLARQEERKVTGRRSPRRYLLSGQLRCGRCENVLYSAKRATTRRYVCNSGPDHHGCGGLSVVAAPVEELVAAAVLYRLDTPELAAALSGHSQADEGTAELSAAIESDTQQLAELAGLYADKAIGATEWIKARDTIDARITRNRKRLTQRSSHGDLAAIAGQGRALKAEWSALNLDRQAAIIRAVVAYVTIKPANGIPKFDPNRVLPVWRL